TRTGKTSPVPLSRLGHAWLPKSEPKRLTGTRPFNLVSMTRQKSVPTRLKQATLKRQLLLPRKRSWNSKDLKEITNWGTPWVSIILWRVNLLMSSGHQRERDSRALSSATVSVGLDRPPTASTTD